MLRNFSSLLTIRMQNSELFLPVHGQILPLPLSSDSLISDIYSRLSHFNTKIETLSGTTISRTTRISELQSEGFIIKINDQSFKIVQSDLDNLADQLNFVIGCYSVHGERKHYICKQLTKYEQIAIKSQVFDKTNLISMVNEVMMSKERRKLEGKTLEEEIRSCFKELGKVDKEFGRIERKARMVATGYMWGGFAITLAQMAYIGSGTYYYYCWDIMEAKAYLIGLANTIVGLSIFSRYGIDSGYSSVYTSIYQSYLKKYADRENFSLSYHSHLKEKLKSLQSIITLDSN